MKWTIFLSLLEESPALLTLTTEYSPRLEKALTLWVLYHHVISQKQLHEDSVLENYEGCPSTQTPATALTFFGSSLGRMPILTYSNSDTLKSES